MLTDMSAFIELCCRPTSASVSLYEPVFIDCTIKNRSESAQRIDLGSDRVGAFLLSIESPAGVMLHDLRREPSGFVQSGDTEIPPYAERVERLLLQRWHSLAAEGRYTVLVALALGSIRLSAAPFDICVLPRDPARLLTICESLATSAMSPGDAEQSNKAAEALAHVTDLLAVPYLRQLLTNGHALQLQAIAGLGRIDDNASRTLLRELSQYQDQEIAAFARRALCGAPDGDVMD